MFEDLHMIYDLCVAHFKWKAFKQQSFWYYLQHYNRNYNSIFFSSYNHLTQPHQISHCWMISSTIRIWWIIWISNIQHTRNVPETLRWDILKGIEQDLHENRSSVCLFMYNITLVVFCLPTVNGKKIQLTSLRLVVYPIMYLQGFWKSQVVSRISSIKSMVSSSTQVSPSFCLFLPVEKLRSDLPPEASACLGERHESQRRWELSAKKKNGVLTPLTFQGTNIIPPGEKEDHLPKVPFSGGYVSFPRGYIIPLVSRYVLRKGVPLSWFLMGLRPSILLDRSLDS